MGEEPKDHQILVGEQDNGAGEALQGNEPGRRQQSNK